MAKVQKTFNMADRYIDLPVQGGGGFGSDPRLQWDSVRGALNMNGMIFTVLSSAITLANNQTIPADIFSYEKAAFKYCVVEYSLHRADDTHVGRLFITNNDLSVSLTDDFDPLAGSLGIIFSAIIDGDFVKIQYTSTDTGYAATFKYTVRQWI